MATVDEVYEIVKEIDKNVDDLVRWKASMEATCKAHRKETNELKETIYGNPGGLRTKVEKLWNCKNGLAEWKSLWMYVLKIVIAAGTLGLIIWILKSIFGNV